MTEQELNTLKALAEQLFLESAKLGIKANEAIAIHSISTEAEDIYLCFIPCDIKYILESGIPVLFNTDSIITQ